jgi:SAM-dependent methyltransferase
MQSLRKLAGAALRRWLPLRPLLLSALDGLAYPLLVYFRVRHPRPDAPSIGFTDYDVAAVNRAADEYFARVQDVSHLERKPFSEPAALSRRLIDLGVLIDGLRLVPGDTVLELGAGSCWVSHFLNKMGCRTISVDVSPAALAIGRKRFEGDSTTDWSRNPEFQPYDGRHLPVPDASVDAIVLYDAFHHLPNPDILLREMRRVLRGDGIVGMSEPGRGHASSAPSRAESGGGVLERELVVEDIANLARQAGFTAARSIVAPNAPLMEVSASKLRAFMGGTGFSRYWSELCIALDSHYYVLLFAGNPEPTTRRPKHLRAVLTDVHTHARVDVARGQPALLRLRARNVGDTRWLSGQGAGWTRLGAHLYRDGSPWTLVDYEWFRHELPVDVPPEAAVTLAVRLPPIDAAGDYIIAFDMVVEGVTWFADRESSELHVRCRVR